MADTAETLSDSQLVRAMATGDAEALRSLSARYARALTALAYRILRDESDAEEVAADVLWQAWREAGAFQLSRGSVAAWLMMIGRSRSIDRSRAKLARRVPVDSTTEPQSAPDPTHGIDLADRAQKVKAALSSLDRAERELLELAYFSDLSQSQIAERLQMPLGTVKTRIRNGMLRLREVLRPLTV